MYSPARPDQISPSQLADLEAKINKLNSQLAALFGRTEACQADIVNSHASALQQCRVVNSDETLGWGCSHVDPEQSVFLSPNKQNDLFSNRGSIQSNQAAQPGFAAKIRSALAHFLQGCKLQLPFCQRRQLEEELSKSISVDESEQSIMQVVEHRLKGLV